MTNETESKEIYDYEAELKETRDQRNWIEGNMRPTKLNQRKYVTHEPQSKEIGISSITTNITMHFIYSHNN